MVTLASLWLPILVATLLVWMASAVIWTVSPIHKADFKRLPQEDEALNALRSQGLAPGQYSFPFASSMADAKTPEFEGKMAQGPVGFLTIRAAGPMAMGKMMVQSVLFYLVVSLIIAYVAGRALPPAAEYLTVFRLVGTVAWLGYGASSIPTAIWFGVPWSNTWKGVFDALIYGLLTAGAFAAFWPSMS